MKTKKLQLLFSIAIIFFAFAISSCKSNSEIKLGLLIPSSKDSRWPEDQKYIESYAKEKGVSVITKSAENDESLQIQQGRELIAEGVDVIILIASNQVTAAAIVRDAHAAGIKVIAYDRIISNCDLDYLISFKGEDIGNLMVEYALKIKPEGNYVLLYGDAMDANALAIRKAQEEALKPYIESKKINIVYKGFQEEWARDFANNTMKRILSFSNQNIDAVITSYDGLALGAIDAFEDAGIELKNSVVITGQDAELDACRAIVDGKMTMTLYKSMKVISKTSVEIAIKLAKHKRITEVNAKVNNGRIDVPSIMLKPKVVDINTLKNVIIDDGFYTTEQLYSRE